mmetsp:Transcript_13429/g.47041  ORF Transcript_13429/g.47041 Transcript_13429/m.47041 type:complete len:187 (-) Transcript_13429:146-706(-)
MPLSSGLLRLVSCALLLGARGQEGLPSKEDWRDASLRTLASKSTFVALEVSGGYRIKIRLLPEFSAESSAFMRFAAQAQCAGSIYRSEKAFLIEGEMQCGDGGGGGEGGGDQGRLMELARTVLEQKEVLQRKMDHVKEQLRALQELKASCQTKIGDLDGDDDGATTAVPDSGDEGDSDLDDAAQSA